MNRIFHQTWKLYPKTSRLIAAEILLDNEPSPMDFTNILLATRELEPEMSRLLLSKIQSILHNHQHPTRYCTSILAYVNKGRCKQITVGILFSASYQGSFQSSSGDTGKPFPHSSSRPTWNGEESFLFHLKRSKALCCLRQGADLT